MKLYQYQEQYLRGLGDKAIMAADTGTGKTFMSLAHYDRRAYGKPLLILAPASKIATGDWQRDVDEYYTDERGNMHLQPEVLIVSYERFSRASSPKQYRETKSRGLMFDWLAKHPRGFSVIADEVHRAKNPQSGIGRAVFRVAQAADTFVGLSATPLPNGWIDAANYLKIFGYTKNITEFKARYCDIVTYKGFPEIKGYKLEDELTRYWTKIAKPLSKASALDLPPITTVPVRIETAKQYRDVLKERLVGDKFIDNASAYLHALRQANTVPKILWLDDFLEGVSDNVVIFYNYKSEYDAIMAMIKKSHKGRTVFTVNGDKHEAPSKSEWAGLSRTITVAQYQSGSTGIELTYAATTIYFSPTYSYSNYEQSIGRTNRNGQTKKMTFYMVCAPGTIEREVWDALRNKLDFQDTQWLAQQEAA